MKKIHYIKKSDLLSSGIVVVPANYNKNNEWEIFRQILQNNLLNSEYTILFAPKGLIPKAFHKYLAPDERQGENDYDALKKAIFYAQAKHLSRLTILCHPRIELRIRRDVKKLVRQYGYQGHVTLLSQKFFANKHDDFGLKCREIFLLCIPWSLYKKFKSPY